MATKFDLLNAVNESLTRSGKLNKLKAEMRAEVMKVLDSSSSVTKPEIPKETSLACELVREFLLWNGFQYTASSLVAESDELPGCVVCHRNGDTEGTNEERELESRAWSCRRQEHLGHATTSDLDIDV